MNIDSTKLRAIRLARGLTQEELAARSGYGVRTLRRMERSQAQPNPRTVREIAQALGVAVTDLLAAAPGAPDPARPRSSAQPGWPEILLRSEPAGDDPLARSLAEELGAELTRRLGRVRVLRLSTPEHHPAGLAGARGSEVECYEVATRVRVQDRTVRVWIRISDIALQRVLWSERLDVVETSEDGLLSLADRAGEEVFARLHTALLEVHISRDRSAPAPSIWDELMGALRVALQKTPRGIAEAIGRLEALLEATPDFFPGCAALATLIPYDFRAQEPRSALEVALSLAERATRLDPRYVPGQLALASIRMLLGDHRRALDHARTAIDLEPVHGPSHRVLAEILAGMGRAKASLDAADEALRLTPSSDPLACETWLCKGVAHFAAGSPAEGLAPMKHGLSLGPTGPHADLWYAVSLASAGRLTEARASSRALPDDVSIETICGLRGILEQAYAPAFQAALASFPHR